LKAVILAAGKGERLQPITETRPKPLIPVLCKPLIYWQINALKNVEDVDEIIVVVSYMKDKVVEYVNSMDISKPVRFIDQGVEKGTGDAVLKALEKIGGGEALIIYGDIYLKDWSVLKQLASIDRNVIAGVEVDRPENYGVLMIEGNLLKDIVEKPSKPLSNIVNAGLYKVSVDDVLKNADVEPSPRGEIEFTDIVKKINAGKQFYVYRLEKDSWIDIGLPWNVIEANKMALEIINHSVKGFIEDYVVIKPPVYIGLNTIVRSGSYIEGPVYIGENVDIGPNARIRPYSVICDYSRIGFSVEVKESVIFEHVHASHLSYIGDSVVCEYVNLGAGTITANLRFDDQPVKMTIRGVKVSSGRRKLGAVIGGYVKTGVNVSLMPGVKIGSYSWIEPGLVVYDDIPSKTFYRSGNRYIKLQ